FPKRPCHIICHHLPDDRGVSRANPSLIHNSPILHVARGISNRARRSESNLPRCPFSDRCSRGLVHWCGLGIGLLGAGGVAPERRLLARDRSLSRLRVAALLNASAGTIVRQGERTLEEGLVSAFEKHGISVVLKFLPG